jgi:SOS response regulatory protein OraA/RecX
MLARREHSVSELTEKLSIKGFELKDINSAVQSLIEKNIQSDER